MGWEGAHGQDDPVPGQVESLHTFLSIPLLAPALSPAAVSWLEMPLLAQGAGSPRKRDGASSSQHKNGHGVGQGPPCLPGMPPAPWGLGCEKVLQANKKPLNISERSFSSPSTLISSPPPTSQSSQQSCSPALFPPAQHPETLPQPPSPARSCHLQTLGGFFNYIYFFFLVLFFSTPCLFPCHRPPPGPPPLATTPSPWLAEGLRGAGWVWGLRGALH